MNDLFYLYLGVSYLIGTGIQNYWQYTEGIPGTFATCLAFILSPIFVPVYIGYKIAKM